MLSSGIYQLFSVTGCLVYICNTGKLVGTSVRPEMHAAVRSPQVYNSMAATLNYTLCIAVWLH